MRRQSARPTRWICRQTVCRPNTRRYATLSLACLFGSLPAAIGLVDSNTTRFLPWAGFVGWFLILLDVAMIVLTVWSALTEKPRTMTLRYPDPNYELLEGEPFAPWRTIQSRQPSAKRCALFPLPEGEGQGEGKRRGHHPRYGTGP